MKNDQNWIDQFYSELERSLTDYTRPSDWQERFSLVQEKVYKPVRWQTEGRKVYWRGEYD